MRSLACAQLLLALGLAGCSGLLPRGSSVASSPFSTYDEAKAAFGPHRALQDLGGPAGRSGVRPAEQRQRHRHSLPRRWRGSRRTPARRWRRSTVACATACWRSRPVAPMCTASASKAASARANSSSDFFNFRRITHIEGWRFEAMVVARDDLVLFKNVGGEPRIDVTERQVNPLGPFQSGGEAAGSWTRRDFRVLRRTPAPIGQWLLSSTKIADGLPAARMWWPRVPRMSCAPGWFAGNERLNAPGRCRSAAPWPAAARRR